MHEATTSKNNTNFVNTGNFTGSFEMVKGGGAAEFSMQQVSNFMKGPSTNEGSFIEGSTVHNINTSGRMIDDKETDEKVDQFLKEYQGKLKSNPNEIAEHQQAFEQLYENQF